MEITNNQRVGRALDLLRDGLRPYVKRQFNSRYKNAVHRELQGVLDNPINAAEPFAEMDVNALLKLMNDRWSEVFDAHLGLSAQPMLYPTARTLIYECRSVRHQSAHHSGDFSNADAYRALDSIQRLLASVPAKEAQAVQRLREEQFEILAGEGNVATQQAIQEILEEALELTRKSDSGSGQSASPLLEEALQLTKNSAAVLRQAVRTSQHNALTRLDLQGKASSIVSRLSSLREGIRKRAG